MNKKVFIILLAVGIAVFAVCGFLILKETLSGGASSPEKAVWGYEKASMLYDVDSMIKYSSGYNTVVLGYANPTDEPLEDYLNRVYSSKTSIYAEKELTYSFDSLKFIEKADSEFDNLYQAYCNKDSKAEVTRFAYLILNIYSDGVKIIKYPAYAVEYGGRWYFYKPEVLYN